MRYEIHREKRKKRVVGIVVTGSGFTTLPGPAHPRGLSYERRDLQKTVIQNYELYKELTKSTQQWYQASHQTFLNKLETF
ncbi:hypothetical protein AVEN_154576-1 [Araneus ventricosus]|uniref:Uncharacterized protein n=1 Tax=Araneus ventricosus TaxID=182803 RepID=A0A4Y2E343_ARAVE|nr:hypothetical protein AVEN_154576-1 [Araneus ventricosus]